MDKKSIPILVALFALMVTWPVIDSKFIRPMFPQPPPKATVTPGEATELPSAEKEAAPLATQPDTLKSEPATDVAAPLPSDEPPPDLTSVPASTPEAEQWTLENDSIIIAISSLGGGIQEATLKKYREQNTDDSPLIHMDFNAIPSLSYRGLPGFDMPASFTLKSRDGSTLVLERRADHGMILTRTLQLLNEYEVRVTDVLANTGETEFRASQPLLQLGPITRLPGTVTKGLVDIGLDVLPTGAPRPEHIGDRLDSLFSARRKETGSLPLQLDITTQTPVDWVAVKNKYFVQIVRPGLGGYGYTLHAVRETDPREREDASFVPKHAAISRIAGAVLLPELAIRPGETLALETVCYVGPKRYDLIQSLGFGQEGVMEFASTGFFKSFNIIMVPIKVALLWMLNWMYDHVWPHNYGIAIILLTILIRIIFWPITHKSTESMKRMAELAPLLKPLKEKYKDDPRKLQEATMALYKEHKINPMGGCLPMVIQIPVFIALFVVLRNAIELRFAHFLWVTDLSEPENLLAGVLPIPLNILPLIMVVTQFIQQKMTPTSGDPQQAKMMQWMPVMFLFFFYTMPSGLVLYWTVSNLLMIIQQVCTKKKPAAALAATAPREPSRKQTRSKR